MSSRVTLTLNYPRRELLEDGWSTTKTAKSVTPGRWRTNLSGNIEWRSEELPKSLWREPNFGVIMLRPSTLRADFIESDDWRAFQFLKDQILFGDDDQFLQADTVQAGVLSKWVITPKRSVGSALLEIAIKTAMLAILTDEYAGKLIPVGQTKDNLLPNEGFSVVVHPAGLAADRAESFFSVFFGGDKFHLDFGMDGQFRLHYNFGDDVDANWAEILREEVSFGSVGHVQPFQVTVIPWGTKYISILFSSAKGGRSPVLGKMSGAEPPRYLVDLEKAGIATPLDDSIYQHIKTESGPITICMRATLYTSSFSIHRVKYPSDPITVTLGPIAIPEPKSNLPETSWIGFADPTGTRPSAPSLDIAARGETGIAWTNDDVRGSVEVTLQSSPNQVYSPELWSIDFNIPSVTHTPDWTPVDKSDSWTYIRFGLSSRSNPARMEVKLHGGDTSKLYQRGGPVRLSILDLDDVTELPVFDGYIMGREPTPFGAIIEDRVRGKLREEFWAHDMWHRLNHHPVGNSLSLESRTVGQVFRELIKRGGFEDEDIEIDPLVDELVYKEFDIPDELETFAADATIGDVIRDIQGVINVQFSDGLRVYWDGAKWQIYFAFQWDESENWPETIFLLDQTLLGIWDTTPDLARPDSLRWKPGVLGPERFYFAQSSIEINVDLPAYNGLEIVAAKGGTASGEAVLVAIAPGVIVSDDSDINFEGRLRNHVIAPPEAIGVKSIEEVAAWARAEYDREQRRGLTANLEAEWQPEVKPDDFCMILGRAPDGTPISYGCWRIETIDVEMESDIVDPKFRTDYSWSGSYYLVYQGRTNHPDFPMFDTIGGIA